MKQCPQCYKIYSDGNLNFCLADGSILAPLAESSNEETVIMTWPINKVQEIPARSSVSPVLTYIGIGLISLIIGGAIMAWIGMSSDFGRARSSLNEDNHNSSKEKLNFEAEDAKTKKSPLIEANQNVVAATPKIVTPSPTPIDSKIMRESIPTTGNWFVILGSYQRHETMRADQKLRHIQSLGYSADILDTNNYPKLTRDLWIVAIGPYSQKYSRNLAAQIKSKGAEAYIKAGW